jgi:RNA polymerase sigma factor (sigma-70 family)
MFIVSIFISSNLHLLPSNAKQFWLLRVRFPVRFSLRRLLFSKVNASSDHLLLRDYAENRSEAAFADLVRRYVDFVYSAALRMVRDEQAAQDVTQSVFVALARHAPQLAGRRVLSGWLHCTAQNLAFNSIRSDVRRRAREQHAAAMNQSAPDDSASLWERIAPQLDAALAQLSQSDRDALLLRYFQNKSIREVAETLATTESAAQKRVNRAVERLRKIFARHGLAAGTGRLAVSISAHAVEAAPPAMASASSSAGLLAGAARAIDTTTKGLMILQKALVATAFVAVVATALYALHLHSQIRSLRQRDSLLARQLEQFQRERDDALDRAALLEKQSQSFEQGRRDLARLRAEVSRWRAMPTSPASVPAIPQTPATNFQVLLQAKFVSLPDDTLKSMGIQWTPDPEGGSHGLLTAEQLQAITQAFTNDDDIDVIAAPRVTTANGMEAAVSTTTAVQINETNANIGATLDVTADFSTNDSTFNLQCTAKFSELIGDPLQPQLYTLQTTNQATLPRGQTLVLQRELSPNAWLPDYTNTSGLPRSLVVSVTPEVIDPAGNPLSP